MRRGEQLKGRSVQAQLKVRFGLDISIRGAFRALAHAKQNISGDRRDSFTKIGPFLEVIKPVKRPGGANLNAPPEI